MSLLLLKMFHDFSLFPEFFYLKAKIFISRAKVSRIQNACNVTLGIFMILAYLSWLPYCGDMDESIRFLTVFTRIKAEI